MNTTKAAKGTIVAVPNPTTGRTVEGTVAGYTYDAYGDYDYIVTVAPFFDVVIDRAIIEAA